jgi:4-aminobutyrate aminotransferase-like enzyme
VGDTLLAVRQQRVGFNLSLSYEKHLHIVRGLGQTLFDIDGQPYLDCVNNVSHVGHSHPQVYAALAQQARVLNTNTRYLHENIVRYAERLTGLLPDPLSVCFFVNSGSEANDLAIRMTRSFTGQRDMLVLEGAYHGNLSTLIELSPYKHAGPGGEGPGDWVHVLPMPCAYRGIHRESDDPAGSYAHEAVAALGQLQAAGKGVAGFISEAIIGTGGQVVFPDGTLAGIYEAVRTAGGLCIADEVQAGFGRVGAHFWAFETQGVVPDIVTMGKPIGNGHPLAAVVTTPAIASAFHNGMEYFNTFGGNPVSCAVGLAVLDVIEQEGLQARARTVGNQLKAGLKNLQAAYPLIGDVRGSGLFLGIELVREGDRGRPAAEEAAYVVERMRSHGILLSTDGPLHNVIKIKPPLVFNEDDAARVLAGLQKVLAEVSP